MKQSLRNRWFAYGSFYKEVLLLAFPIMLQNAVTNFVNLLDNIMIGTRGTLEMSAVSIANQLLFIFTILTFGCVNAAGIFSAQYAGNDDQEGVRNCLRMKMVISVTAALIAVLVFLTKGSDLIQLYLNNDQNSAADAAFTLKGAVEYLRIMLIGLVPFALSQSFSSTMREDQESAAPMRASFLAVGVNFVFNYILIFGKLGFPALGIHGAAAATVLSRFTELAYLLFTARRMKYTKPYFDNIFKGFHIPASLAKNVMIKGTPLVVNEFLWSLGLAGIGQAYSTRGLSAVAAYNIFNTVNGVFLVVAIGMGTSIGIMVGRQLGAGEPEKAVQYDRWLIVFAVLLSALTGLVMILMAPLFPKFYNTDDSVRQTAAWLIRIAGIMQPVSALNNGCYFTLRCGGKTLITFLSDSVFTCLISWTLARTLAAYTSLDIVYMVLIVSSADLIKAAFGLTLVEKGVWIHNLSRT